MNPLQKEHMGAKNKLLSKVIIFILILIILFVVTPWGIEVTKRQLEFGNMCRIECEKVNQSYETHYMSTFRKLNGRCFCREELILEDPKQQK